ncbi:MAG: glycosyltransferase family 4 protein [Planctomycetaceae bacterium]|nr:glycosyltransferase family 4 protein [Planctomycetaceae bacterium]
MKIALISYGFSEYCVAQANELATQADVLLAMPEDAFAESDIPVSSNVQCVAFRAPRLRQPFQQMGCLRRLLRSIQQFRPDVVHMQSGHLWFNMALPLLRRAPLVVTIHDPRHHPGDKLSQKTPQAILNYGYRRAQRAIVHSEYVRQQVVDLLKISASKVDVVPHVAIGERDADSSHAEAPSPLDSQEPKILFFGRIWEYKGLEFFIRAQPDVSSRFPNARFVIGGSGEDFDRYKQLMSDRERFDVYNEWISDELRTRLFQEASVVVLPYIEASQSGVIPVAYSFAKPVIVSRVGGLPEMVEDGRTGFIVPPRDSGALARAITALLQNPDRRRAMGIAGQEKLQRECAPAVVANQTLSVYERTIAEFRAPLGGLTHTPQHELVRGARATNAAPAPVRRSENAAWKSVNS